MTEKSIIKHMIGDDLYSTRSQSELFCQHIFRRNKEDEKKERRRPFRPLSTFFESDDVAAKKVRQKAQIMTALSIKTVFKPAVQVGTHDQKPSLKIHNISWTEKKGWKPSISLHVNEGEIFGIGGVDGNGQQEFFEIMSRIRKPKFGQITWNGGDFIAQSSVLLREQGVHWIGPDRHRDGLWTKASAFTNITQGSRSIYNAWGWYRKTVAKERVRNCFEQFDIQPKNIKWRVRNFSGGNQQKLIMARELLGQNVKLLIICNPTRGVDVRNSSQIYERLWKLKKQGVSILLFSSDLYELTDVCDRMTILFHGEMMGIAEKHKFDRGQMGRWLVGMKS